MNSSNRYHALGFSGEAYVAQALRARGFAIVAQNLRIRGGEIDIIATRADLLVCVEVKTRRTAQFSLSTVITPKKQQLLFRALNYYLMDHPWSYTIRFDVALLTAHENGWNMEYISNAFQPSMSIR